MLIFDEAHNIEDVCREAASTEVDLQTMHEVGAVGGGCSAAQDMQHCARSPPWLAASPCCPAASRITPHDLPSPAHFAP